MSFEQVLAGATLEKDRKRKEKKRALKEEKRPPIYFTRNFQQRPVTTPEKHHAQIFEKQRTSDLWFWPSGYLLTIPNNLEQSGRFCQSKLLRGNGSVGWPRYASHACTSNTIVLSARLAEYYRSRASIIIFRKSSDWIRSGSSFDIESSANFPLEESVRIESRSVTVFVWFFPYFLLFFSSVSFNLVQWYVMFFRTSILFRDFVYKFLINNPPREISS